MRGGVTDAGQTNDEQLNIELLSQWKLEAEFRNIMKLFVMVTTVLDTKSRSFNETLQRHSLRRFSS